MPYSLGYLEHIIPTHLLSGYQMEDFFVMSDLEPQFHVLQSTNAERIKEWSDMLQFNHFC